MNVLETLNRDRMFKLHCLTPKEVMKPVTGLVEKPAHRRAKLVRMMIQHVDLESMINNAKAKRIDAMNRRKARK